MKEATGELSMTVVVILAVVAIAGIVAALKGPLSDFIEGTFKNQADAAIDKVND